MAYVWFMKSNNFTSGVGFGVMAEDHVLWPMYGL